MFKKKKEEVKVEENKPTPKQAVKSPIKLKMLFIIVNREKAEYYIDLLEQFEINLQLEVYSKGTATKQMLSMLGLENNDKVVLMAFIKDSQVKKVTQTLEEKFNKIKNGKGIAFTVPLKSIIGTFNYTYLTNQKGGL